VIAVLSLISVVAIGNDGVAAASPQPLQCNFPGTTCVVDDVTSQSQIKARVQTFQEDIQHIGIVGQIQSCDTMIWEGVQHEHAYGAACVVLNGDQTRNWIICDDELVGNLAAEFGANIPDTRRAYLIAYTRDHCLGG
jgi:hypothetical protein